MTKNISKFATTLKLTSANGAIVVVLLCLGLFVGKAFYADEFGPLPFAVGRSMPDKYYVFKFKQ